MNIIKNFREQLGLSQQDLASYLSLAKSQISMVESGLRELPTPALIKLAFFEQASLVAIEDIKKNKNTEIEKHVDYCKKKIILLEKKYITMKSNYNQGLKLLQAINKSRESLTNSNESKKDKKWLTEQEQMAKKKIITNNKEVQKLLQIQIKALKYEVKLSLENEKF